MHLRVANVHNHLEVYVRWEKQFWEAQEPNWWTQPVSGTALILSQVYLTHHLYSYPMTRVAISVQNFLCISLFLFKWELEMRTLIPKQFSSAKYQRAKESQGEGSGHSWAQQPWKTGLLTPQVKLRTELGRTRDHTRWRLQSEEHTVGGRRGKQRREHRALRLASRRGWENNSAKIFTPSLTSLLGRAELSESICDRQA